MAQSQHAARGEIERVYVAMVRTVREIHNSDSRAPR